MKLKYLQGGTFVPPFAVYLPFITPTADENSSRGNKKSSSDEDGLDMKDIYSLIKDLDGLPGDMSHVSNLMNQLLSNIEYKLNNASMFGGTSSIAAEYMQLLNLASNLKFQRDKYNKAYDTAVSNGSIHEAAINSRGQIMVLTNDGPSWITPEKYAESPEDYHVVTNLELLNFRALGQGGLSFDLESISTVSNGMGIEKVNKLISDAILNLGNTSSNTNSGYVGMKTGDLLLGLLDYQTALLKSGRYDASILDLYEVKLLTESQADLAKLALQYIYYTLPATAKSLLKMKSNGKDSGAEALIGTLITSKLKYKTDFDPNLVGGPSAKKSGKTESNDLKTNIEDSFLWRVLQNLGTHLGIIKINNESNLALTLKGTIFELVLTPDNKHIGDDSIANMLNNSHLRSITIGKAYFGNQIISEEDMKKIMYKGDGLMRTNLPVDDDGKPAFELLDLWESLKLDADLTKTSAKDLLATDKYKKLRQYFNNDGSWNKNKVKPFIVFNGMTTDGLINIEPKNKFVADKDTSADMVGRLKLGLSTKVGSDMTYPDIDEQNWYEPFGIQYDHVYEGTIYMPIHMNKNSSILNQGVDLGITYDIEEEYLNSLKPDYLATNINMLK